MNKLYVLGALLLSTVEAGKFSGTIAATDVTVAAMPGGSYTYTSTGDCFSAATATTLGMNNKYYQYYTFDVAAGTKSFALATPTTGASSALMNHNYAYAACTHTHLYNWMAVPVMGTAAAQAGLGTAVVAYGYVLTGTAVTSCVNTIGTATLYTATTKVFTGAAYQTISVTMSYASATGGTANTIAQNVRVKQGNENLDSLVIKTAATISTFSTTAASEGILTNGASNHYWDFMQTNVFQGMTQFGRGGGASTSPCGWWVVYAHEQPGPTTGSNNAVTSGAGIALADEDAYPSVSKATIHMWSDNSLMLLASSSVLSLVTAILF